MTEPRDPQHDPDTPRPPDAPDAPDGKASDVPGSSGSADAVGWDCRGDGGDDEEVPGAQDLPRLARALRWGQPGEEAVPARVDGYVAAAAREQLEPIRAARQAERQQPASASPSVAAAGDVSREGRSAPLHRDGQQGMRPRQRPSPMHRLRWRIGVGAGLAAAAVMAVVVVNMQLPPSGPRPLPAPAEGERVTIVDAFDLARALEAGQPVDPGWDFTGDGQVDQRDVRAIANRAVAVADREDGTQSRVQREGRES